MEGEAGRYRRARQEARGIERLGAFPPAPMPVQHSNCDYTTRSGRHLAAGQAIGRLSELQRQIAAPKRGEAASASFDSWMRTARPAEIKLVAMQLLEQWYTGVYRDDRQVLVVSYEDALMYRPCAGVHPVPTRCGGDTLLEQAAQGRPRSAGRPTRSIA
jgi:hypothetical protein